MNGSKAKNKFGFVDGLIKQPTTEDPTYRGWIKCDTMLLCLIMNSVSKQII